AVFVPQIHDRIIGPAEAHRDWLLNLVARDNHAILDDFRLGAVELAVRAGDGETGQGTALGDEAPADVFESERRLVAFHIHALVGGAGVFDFLAVSEGAGGESQTSADRLLLRGM